MGEARARMVAAAFDLFEERGFAETTVEAIVERAGVSRSTFFRAFGTKEDVIFPGHADLLDAMAARLDAVDPHAVDPEDAAARALAVEEAAALVLDRYLADGDLALRRYRLTRAVPALRARELAGMLGYQRLFREHLREWLGGPHAAVDAELVAAAVVAGHNAVLRRWLRGLTDRPRAELRETLARVRHLYDGIPAGGPDRLDRLAGEVARLADEVARLRAAADEGRGVG